MVFGTGLGRRGGNSGTLIRRSHEAGTEYAEEGATKEEVRKELSRTASSASPSPLALSLSFHIRTHQFEPPNRTRLALQSSPYQAMMMQFSLSIHVSTCHLKSNLVLTS